MLTPNMIFLPGAHYVGQVLAGSRISLGRPFVRLSEQHSCRLVDGLSPHPAIHLEFKAKEKIPPPFCCTHCKAILVTHIWRFFRPLSTPLTVFIHELRTNMRKVAKGWICTIRMFSPTRSLRYKKTLILKTFLHAAQFESNCDWACVVKVTTRNYVAKQDDVVSSSEDSDGLFGSKLMSQKCTVTEKSLK